MVGCTARNGRHCYLHVWTKVAQFVGQRNQLGSAGLFRTRGCVRVAYQCIRISHLVHADHEKVEYFRRLAEIPNVSVIAKEMGVLRVRCYTWAHKAGIFTSEARKVNPRKEEFCGIVCRDLLALRQWRESMPASARRLTGISASRLFIEVGFILMVASCVIRNRRLRVQNQKEDLARLVERVCPGFI